MSPFSMLIMSMGVFQNIYRGRGEGNMMVIIVNGSPHENGCTQGALEEAAAVLKNYGIDTEWFWLGREPVAGCIACKHCQTEGRCYKQDMVNVFLDKAEAADGFLFGSPVYFAGITGQLKCFMDRVFYCGNFAGKPAAAVVSCRRGGASTAYDQINKYFQIRSMPVVTSQYWNQVHGNGNVKKDLKEDQEGLQTMRTLGENMAWLLHSIESGNIPRPVYEKKIRTDFHK